MSVRKPDRLPPDPTATDRVAWCKHCGRLIRRSNGGGEPYWYHPLDAFSTIWCDGWGDAKQTGRQAEPEGQP